MNPFHVPGAGDGVGPLCPHTDPEHEQFYVPVDHTLLAFKQFQNDIGDAASVRASGRLVVALGRDGCGKSSLLNRCAAKLKSQLHQGEEARCQVFSFVDACDLNISREARERAVYQCILDELDARGMIPSSQHRDRLNESKDDLRIGYRYLSRYVLKSPDQKDTTLVILLPRTELKEEIESYARWTFPNLVFLAESREVEQVRAHWTAIKGANTGSVPICLEVHQLEEIDGWTFVKARNAHRTDGEHPFVAEKTIRRVSKRGDFSIRQLENLLFGLYQELMGESADKGSLGSRLAGEVTYDTITDFYFRRGTM